MNDQAGRHPVRLWLAGLLVLAMAVFAACAPEPEPEPADIREASYTATEWEFDGPAELEEGWTRITLTNDGEGIHHLQLIRLDEELTIEDIFGAMEEEFGQLPEGASWAGGPSTAAPGGGTATAYAELTPGNYIAVDVIPDEDGVPGAMHGMVLEITVTESDDELLPEPPEHDFVIDMDDFFYELEADVEAGEQTVQVTNVGSHPHEAVMFQLAEDAEVADIFAFFGGELEGPPPFASAGGLQVVEPEATGYYTWDFESGERYVLLCFVVDPETGQTHVELGMVLEFEVE